MIINKVFYFLLFTNKHARETLVFILTICCHSNNNKLDFLGRAEKYFQLIYWGNDLLFFMFVFICVHKKKKTLLSLKILVANLLMSNFPTKTCFREGTSH